MSRSKSFSFSIPRYLIPSGKNSSLQIREILASASPEFNKSAFEKAIESKEKVTSTILIDYEQIDFISEYQGVHNLKSMNQAVIAILSAHHAIVNFERKPLPSFHHAFAVIGGRV